MKHTKYKKAFSMLTAIIVIVLMATVAAFIMSLSSKMTKGTTVQYQREQAKLLAKSYTEYAIMAVMANDRGVNCLNTITSNNVLGGVGGAGYNVQANIGYIGNNTLLLCAANAYAAVVNTPESPLNIIVDVYVTYPDLDNPNNINMTYHRRTLQKI